MPRGRVREDHGPRGGRWKNHGARGGMWERRKSRSCAAAATGVVEVERLQSRLASLPRQDTEVEVERLQSRLASLPRQDTDTRTRGANADTRMRCDRTPTRRARCGKTTVPGVGGGKTTTPGVGGGSDASRDPALRRRRAWSRRKGCNRDLRRSRGKTPTPGRVARTPTPGCVVTERRCPEAGRGKTTAPGVGGGKTTTPGVGCGSDASRDPALRRRQAWVEAERLQSRLASLPRQDTDTRTRCANADTRMRCDRTPMPRGRAREDHGARGGGWENHDARGGMWERRKSRSRAAAATGVVEAERLQSRLASLPRQDTDTRTRGANADTRMRCDRTPTRRGPVREDHGARGGRWENHGARGGMWERRKSRSCAAAATGVVEAERLQSRLASLPRQDTEGRMRLQSRLASLPRQDTDSRMRCAPRWVRRWPGRGRAGRLRRGRARKPGG
jgi:hypothetical protein